MSTIKTLATLVAASVIVGGPGVADSCGSGDHAHDAKNRSASTEVTAASATTTPNIVETAAAAGSFTTLLAAVKAAGLLETLSAEGPFTVFAPTDEAFAGLPEGTVETLLKPENKARLQAILTYHVVPGRVPAADVVKLDKATTVQGQDVTITVADGAVMVNGAHVVSTDIETSNGVIHVIDSVILPDLES